MDTLHLVIKLADGTVGVRPVVLAPCEADADRSVQTFELSFSSSPTFVREKLVLVGSSGHIQVDATSDGARQAGFTVALTKASVPEKQSMFFESNGVQKVNHSIFGLLRGTLLTSAFSLAAGGRVLCRRAPGDGVSRRVGASQRASRDEGCYVHSRGHRIRWSPAAALE